MSENCACLSGRHDRAAAPARAREILRTDFEVDIFEGVVAGSPASDNEAGAARIAELRRRVQSGTYRVDAEALSACIIDEHIER